MLILNFHYVNPLPEQSGINPDVFASRQGITITPEGLKNIINTLRFWGYKTVSLADVLETSGPGKLPKKSVLLTFDDGYANNLHYGLPVLEDMKCPATIFLLAGQPDGHNHWDQQDFEESQRDKLLSHDEIKTLAQSPWITFGSHGLNHKPFDELPLDELRQEINESYRLLSQQYPESFLPVIAYPWGKYNQAVVDTMVKSSYKLGFTVEKAYWNQNKKPFEIPRYTAYFSDGNPVKFSLKLFKQWVSSLK